MDLQGRTEENRQAMQDTEGFMDCCRNQSMHILMVCEELMNAETL